MKKKILAITLCTALSAATLTGCGGSAVKKLADTAKEISEQSDATSTPNGPTATPAPKETALAMKKTGKVGDWKFTVKKLSTKKTIKTSKYMEAKASDGNLLVLATLSVTNDGKKEATFLPRVGREDTMMTAKLIYKDNYEYQPSSITGYDKDMAAKSINPLSKKSGIIAFDVPKKVAKDLKSCRIRIGTKSEAIVFSAK
jgi:Telomeric repeat-binding factor 2.